MRWHLLATVAVLTLSWVCRITLVEWCLVTLCIGAVIALECVNTALERLCDRVTLEQDPLIGRAKDAAAAGVLMMCLAAAIVGAIIFGPQVIEFLSPLISVGRSIPLSGDDVLITGRTVSLLQLTEAMFKDNGVHLPGRCLAAFVSALALDVGSWS